MADLNALFQIALVAAVAGLPATPNGPASSGSPQPHSLIRQSRALTAAHVLDLEPISGQPGHSALNPPGLTGGYDIQGVLKT